MKLKALLGLLLITVAAIYFWALSGLTPVAAQSGGLEATQTVLVHQLTAIARTIAAQPTVISTSQAGSKPLWVFVVGADGLIYYKIRLHGAWIDWVSMLPPPPGVSLTTPAVVQGDAGLELFVRSSDNKLWHRTYDGITWTPWENLGGVLMSGPAAIQSDTGLQELGAQ